MRKVLVLLLMCWSVQYAFGWGNTGHRAIAEIAFQNLSKKSKKALDEVLGDSYLPLYANWADEVKSDRDSFEVYGDMPHYANMGVGETYETSIKREGGDVYTLLNDQIAIIKDQNSSDKDRTIAVKLIIHFVADMHQPMHCGRREDRGGNNVKVTWFGSPSNLHRVWDSALINYYNLSYTELARFVSGYAQVDIEILQEAKPIDWLNESKIIADDLYANVGDGKFSYRYAYIHQSTVYSQVEKAGVRLAGLLNELFD